MNAVERFPAAAHSPVRLWLVMTLASVVLALVTGLPVRSAGQLIPEGDDYVVLFGDV